MANRAVLSIARGAEDLVDFTYQLAVLTSHIKDLDLRHMLLTQMLVRFQNEAWMIVRDQEHRVHALAERLGAQPTLTGADVEEVIKQADAKQS
jgi:hypothetical protein